jgi:hypothetical protein
LEVSYTGNEGKYLLVSDLVSGLAKE